MRIHTLHNALAISATAYYCSMLSATTNAFQTPIGPTFGIPQQKQTQNNVFTPTSTSLGASSKEDEIAALEEQLQRLKEEASKEEDGEELAEESSTTFAAGVIDRKSMNDELMPEMLTEQWKESNSAAAEDGESGGLMQTVISLVGGLALLAGVLAFSQVPVGQEDLNKYSTGKAGGSKIDLGDINTVRSSDF